MKKETEYKLTSIKLYLGFLRIPQDLQFVAIPHTLYYTKKVIYDDDDDFV